MPFAANFTAIDFETANRRPDSACQLAAVKVRDGEIVDSAMWMIHPVPFYFAPSNIRIHGITPQRVQNEPKFAQCWDEIATTIGNDCIVAHNASFDIGVLLACLTKHSLKVPSLQYTCTRAIARRVWPKRQRYGLKPLSDWLGVRFRHHDALEDSIACAKILLAAGIDRSANSLPELETALRLSRGTAGPWGKKGPAKIVTRRPRKPGRGGRPTQPTAMAICESGSNYQAAASLDLQRLLVRADFIRPLAGEQVVFTGRLKILSREDAELLAARSGGHCQNRVTKSTSYLVVGSKDERTDSAGRQQSVKQDAAEKLQREGQAIRIVNEHEFLELVAKVPEQ
ncbi:MAG: DNA polymerase III subunit epsilon [Pirellulaceae bacterium]|nr:DNA polymerase III subunit epsilon [Pirellulaceae bacterium]